MLQPKRRSLWDLTIAGKLSSRRIISDCDDQVAIGDLRNSAIASSSTFSGKSVLISCRRQLPAVLSFLQLDGVAKRILLCPPDLSPAYLPAIIAEAGVDVIVSDGTGPADQPTAVHCPAIVPFGLDYTPRNTDSHCDTEWLLFTSGTTGRPKIVVHTLASLAGPLDDGLVVASHAVWSTFYDVRRYGGLQILLRALLAGGSMVLSQADEPVADFLVRAGRAGVTHISGTPSHWRRALMSTATQKIDPRYVRLSGEVADQAILNSLASSYPRADIAHAFASTEAGVAFDVRDRLAGFPAAWIGQAGAKADMHVQDGSLRIRSARTASGYLGDDKLLADLDGFVDTGDMLELRGDRYGQKVHPEEIEAIINQHPAVQMSRVRSRRSAITGAIVVADILRRPTAGENSFDIVKDEILTSLRHTLPLYKVPALLYEVDSLQVSESGKLLRTDA
jgi:acyl-CoA synthetase (AMP-forming)/AMP-acid ligase II